MAFLRSPAECALDEVAILCQEAADEYRTAGDATDDSDLADLFADLERRRREAAAAVMTEIRRMGNLPDAPDADREAMEHLATRVKATLAADARKVLLADCLRLEEKLAAALAAALRQGLPAAALELLRRLEQEGEWIHIRLTAAD